MKRISIILFCIIVFFILYKLRILFYPMDILNYLPLFSLSEWEKPHNSLLADLVFQFEPWRFYIKQQIFENKIPFWNNLNGSGVPFFANPQSAIFFPTTLLYLLFPISLALFLIPLFKILFFGGVTYLYLREINCEKKIAIFASVLIPFTGFFFPWVLWPHTNVFMLLPLLLFFIEKILQNNNKYFFLISVVIFLLVLGGHPETLFNTIFVLFLYSVLRLWRKKQLFIQVLVYILLGFLLGGVVLVPFLEYVFYSNVIIARSENSHALILPEISILTFVFPFFYGAPHSEFYRNFSKSINFQEMAGMYFSQILFMFSIYGCIVYMKNTIIKIWIFISFISFALSFNIFPFSIINSLPFVKTMEHVRLITVGSFGLFIISIITLDSLINKKNQFNIFFLKIILSIAVPSLFIVILFYFLNEKDGSVIIYQGFLRFLFQHIIFLLISSLFGIFLLFIKSKRIFILFLIVLLQLSILFSYFPFTKNNKYYPDNQIIQLLVKDSITRVLDVGNPNFPPNINLIYGIEHAENDDAIELFSYKKYFDTLFPIKNHWKNVDEATYDSLKKIGVTHVISDYDIRDKKVGLQNEKKEIEKLLVNSNFSLDLIQKDYKIEGIRFLTANYNRLNTCTFTVTIIDKTINKSLFEKDFYCKDMRDSMFYSFSFPQIQIHKERLYSVQFSTKNATDTNSIGLWVNSKKQPNLELLLEDKLNSRNFSLLWKEKSVYLFQVIKSSIVDFNGEYKQIRNTSNYVEYITSSDRPEMFLLKRNRYPGWNVTIDNKNVELLSSDTPFFLVKIPQGIHKISFYYVPYSYYLGVFMSLSSFFILILLYVKKVIKR